MYKTILVPVDLSHAEAGQAVINVAKMLGGEGARIILVTVVEDIPAFVVAGLPDGIIEESKERAQEALEEIARKADVQASVEVRSGQAYRAILDVAEKRNADLIVIASHRPGLQQFLLGSTASRVVRHATCTVFVKR
jgi:nucleotide-binding universal stress UspA family protein